MVLAVLAQNAKKMRGLSLAPSRNEGEVALGDGMQ
jgi:hypothetical protein